MSDKNSNEIKLPWFKTLFGHFDLLLGANFSAWAVCLIFTTIETLLFAASGNMAACASDVYNQNHFCNVNLLSALGVRIVIIFWECMFVRNWIEKINKQTKLTIKNTFLPNIKDVKIFALWVAYILTLAIAVGAMYLLYVRVPNPDWHIELLYFASIAWLFLVPLVALRFCCYGGAAALGYPLPKISEVWKRTSGNGIKLCLSLIILIIIGLFAGTNVARFAQQIRHVDSLLKALEIEYIIILVKMIIIALAANFCYMQYTLLFGSKDDDKTK